MRIAGAGWVLAGLMVVLTPSPAAAQGDWVFSPFIAGTFGASTALPSLERTDTGGLPSQLIIGGAAGWWSHSIIGLETEFAYGPRFFERDNLAGLVTNSNMMTLSFDVVATTPLGLTRESLRPYLVGGAGWMHTSIDESQNIFPEIFGRARNSVAMNFGGGAVGFVTPRTGVRFDLRHFRSFERDTNPVTLERMSLLGFWRASVGVVIRR